MSKPAKPYVLSLFDHSGEWARPWAEDSRFEALLFDVQADPNDDVLLIDPRDYGNVAVVLAAPPCDVFTNSSTRHYPMYDRTGATARSMALVQATLDLVGAWRPAVWALENPPGRLERLFPQLGAVEKMNYHPCQFAAWADTPADDCYNKSTNIWGAFNEPQRRPLPRTDNKVPGQSKMSLLPPSKERKNIRSRTPSGFARAFYAANIRRALCTSGDI